MIPMMVTHLMTLKSRVLVLLKQLLMKLVELTLLLLLLLQRMLLHGVSKVGAQRPMHVSVRAAEGPGEGPGRRRGRRQQRLRAVRAQPLEAAARLDGREGGVG